MYLRRISGADAARFRRDPDTVFAATIGTQFGGQPDAFNDVSLDEIFGRPRGFLGRIRAWFIKRALKAALRRQVDQLNKAKAAMGQALAGDSPANIPSPDAMVDLHKSWQIIHYVLTGTPDSGPAPLNVLLSGGEEVGEDLGYGPARIIDARAMQDFAKALGAFDLDAVLKRLDIERMAAAGVYCVGEDDDPEAQAIELEEDMRQYFPALKAFAQKAAAERQGALIWMS